MDMSVRMFMHGEVGLLSCQERLTGVEQSSYAIVLTNEEKQIPVCKPHLKLSRSSCRPLARGMLHTYTLCFCLLEYLTVCMHVYTTHCTIANIALDHCAPKN